MRSLSHGICRKPEITKMAISTKRGDLRTTNSKRSWKQLGKSGKNSRPFGKNLKKFKNFGKP